MQALKEPEVVEFKKVAIPVNRDIELRKIKRLKALKLVNGKTLAIIAMVSYWGRLKTAVEKLNDIEIKKEFCKELEITGEEVNDAIFLLSKKGVISILIEQLTVFEMEEI